MLIKTPAGGFHGPHPFVVTLAVDRALQCYGWTGQPLHGVPGDAAPAALSQQVNDSGVLNQRECCGWSRDLVMNTTPTTVQGSFVAVTGVGMELQCWGLSSSQASFGLKASSRH